MNLRRWLTVGIGVKRWLLLAFVGLLVLAIGVAHVIRQVTASAEPGGPVMSVIDVLTLQFLPYQLRGLIAGAVGLGIFLYGAYRLVRALVDPFAPWDREQPMVEVIYQKRFLARGPRVVAIGGGTGLSTLLRGLKEHTSNLTAVVTAADDGGSSGVLRTELGIPAVGDIRNCIVALADAEPLMGRLLQYRFPGSDPTPAAGADPGLPPVRGAEALSVGLGGHAVGNLLLAAMVALEDGDFEEGVREMNRVLAVRGRVVPATGTVLSLHARLRDGTEVEGQSRIARCERRGPGLDHPGRTFVPETTPCGRSRMPRSSCSVPAASTRASCQRCWCRASARPSPRRARSSCSPATWRPRRARPAATTWPIMSTRSSATAPRSLADVVLANNRLDAPAPEGWLGEPVRLRWPPACAASGAPRLVLDDVVDPVNAHHHDPGRLAGAIIGIWEREGGHRRRQGAARVGHAS